MGEKSRYPTDAQLGLVELAAPGDGGAGGRGFLFLWHQRVTDARLRAMDVRRGPINGRLSSMNEPRAPLNGRCALAIAPYASMCADCSQAHALRASINGDCF
jgi:hypothetical protein